MTDKTGFFAIGKPQWAEVCDMGLNHAVCYLVLARGTGRDNSTTRWSAEAVFKHTGMAWRRAAAAIKEMDNTDLICSLTLKGKRPTRKLAIPADMEHVLWLPNTLVTGARNEMPPLAKLRQAQNLEHLQAFVDLYGLHDLAGDGGLPRRLIYKPFDMREHICDRGQFKVWGFRSSEGMRYCNCTGPLERFKGRKNGEGSAWDFLVSLEDMGLLECVEYLAESDSPDAELIHAISGDDEAVAARDAAMSMAEDMPGGFQYEVQNYDHVFPALKHMQKIVVVGVFRLTYRPHTKRTAAWYAQHVRACREACELYQNLAEGKFHQGLAA